MIIVDSALKKREAAGKPVLVGMIGAGVQAKGIVRVMTRATPGMNMAAIANRTIENAVQAYAEVGLTAVRCDTQAALDAAIAAGQPAVTSDPKLLANAKGLDAIIESTGALEFAAQAVMAAIDGGKHIVSVNAELDGTVGPILKVKANAKGLIYTAADGDQPGAQMNLARFVEGIGLKVVLCGNMKGLYDPYRNPTTQEAFAAKHGLNAAMVASFADGTKISYEQAVIANGMGFKVAKRGMIGPDFSGGDPYKPLVPLEDTISGFSDYLDKIGDGPGIVDYVMGARPGPGIFVLAKQIDGDPKETKFMAYLKMGNGPYYCFYTPFHLCHLEVPGSVARAVLFDDVTVAPLGGATVGVIPLAKKDLEPGEVIGELGGYEAYGMLENIETIREENLIPLGLAIGGTVNKPIKKDQPLTFADIDLPKGRLIDQLYAEQEKTFAAAPVSVPAE